MTKPKKPTLPRGPEYLDESPKQNHVIYEERSSYPDMKMSLVDMIYHHAQKNSLLVACYDWRSITVETDSEAGWGDNEYCLTISCNVDVDPVSLLKIQGHNKSVKIEWEARQELYFEKLKMYEAELALWNTTEAGQKASHAEQVRKLRAKTSETIDKLAEQLKKRKITPEQFISKMKDIEAIGVINDLS